MQELIEQTHLFRQEETGYLFCNGSKGMVLVLFSGKCIFVFAAIGSLWVACCRAQSLPRDAQHRVFWPVEADIAPGNGQKAGKSFVVFWHNKTSPSNRILILQ